ncbi:MAG TPA: alpha/beta fold hydrolase [Rhizomicrobium sp.]|nr:alpha/beta fold hydrolase [Rhizomicrobium sp.]
MAIDQTRAVEELDIRIGARSLPGILRRPHVASAMIVFAHGSGSSRLSPRNTKVAEALSDAGFATLLFDLLEPAEEAAQNRAKVFDIPFLGARLVDAVKWLDETTSLSAMPIGLFGASTGAAAALVAAAQLPGRIGAVVSRGGRPDLANRALDEVRSPTLLIVGGADYPVIDLNARAFARLACIKKMEIVPGATHLFEERGALEQVIALAKAWFLKYLRG